MGTFSVRKTTEQFIADAKAVHDNKYDYSKVQYQGNKIKVCIICPIHGEFWQIPNNHIKGCGCFKCGSETRKKPIHNIGINDVLGVKGVKAYDLWHSMLQRCYSNKYQQKKPTYVNCMVCQEWLTYSNFQKWFNNPQNGYKDGYHLDKDILIKGNKVYSPNTCCFVPNRLNILFTKRDRLRRKYPIGVSFDKGKFLSHIRTDKEKLRHLGTFDTAQEAFNAYKTAKEKYIKELAEKYFQEGKITDRVYNALMKYEVEITD